ncbi:MAG: phospholipase D-like domain-containing protein, partial [Candidatus Hodarchaeota archaeon]
MKKIRYEILTIIAFVTFLLCTINVNANVDGKIFLSQGVKSIQTYTPEFNETNIKEQMTLSPMFTPDNALDIHIAWINRANSSIDIQIPYITAFDAGDNGEDWDSDSSPIVRSLIVANNTRGVNIRVQLNEDSDSDNITSYFQSKGIDVRWMGTFDSKSGESYISTTHTKLLIIDGKVTLLSSINFSFKGLTDNREAGMVIRSETVADYYTQVFESDWADGEKPPSSSRIYSTSSLSHINVSKYKILNGYPSHTNIEKANFTGNYNVTLFTNPDSADKVIFRYLKSAKTSIYVSMYTISRPDFNNTLIDLKNSNPAMDIQVLISNDRVGPQEDIDTIAAAKSLVENLIPVYNSTTDNDWLYHNKYWIIDGVHVFVYSGNWSPRSVTPQLEPGDPYYSSTEMNRDMGIAVHDASDIASFFKTVWDADVAIADAWDLPIGIKQTSFSDTDVVSGTIMLTGQLSGLDDATVSYRWGSNGEYTEVNVINSGFSVEFDTLTLSNGITDFEVKAETSSQTFSDKVKVNIVNYASNENWRLLITELLPNPAVVSDTEGEYIELTNSFPFALFIENWQIGDDNELYTFPSGYTIDAYTSIIIARDLTGFTTGYSKIADIELEIALRNDGDYAQLLDHKGSYMDVVAYG